MAVILNKEDDKNSDLTRRINADLRAKLQENSDVSGGGSTKRDDPDFVEDAEYSKDLKKTSKFGWVWVVLIVLAIISLISIIAF